MLTFESNVYLIIQMHSVKVNVRIHCMSFCESRVVRDAETIHQEVILLKSQMKTVRNDIAKVIFLYYCMRSQS